MKFFRNKLLLIACSFLFSNFAMSMEKTISNEALQFLRDNGYAFVKSSSLTRLFNIFKKNELHKFDEHCEPLSMLEKRYTPEETSKHYKENQQRDSWFLSPRYSGPFDNNFMQEFYKASRPIWKSVIKKIFELNGYDCPYGFSEAIGIHHYDGKHEGVGLHEHYDVGLISILMSDGPLEGKINGKWEEINIPEGHVMIFLANTLNLFNIDNKGLLHRVPHINQKKLSVGIFIDPNMEDSLYVNGEETDKKIMDYFKAYFSNDSSYSEMMESYGRSVD